MKTLLLQSVICTFSLIFPQVVKSESECQSGQLSEAGCPKAVDPEKFIQRDDWVDATLLNNLTVKEHRHPVLVQRPGIMTIPFVRGRRLVGVQIPKDTNIHQWVERLTFMNSPQMSLPPHAKPDQAVRTVFVAKTVETVCQKSTNHVHTATLLAKPTVTGLWATQMTFRKTTDGFACNEANYGAVLGRCMHRFFTPWAHSFSTTKTVSGPKSILTTTPTWQVIVPGPHWGVDHPARSVTELDDRSRPLPCHDEASCHKLCEREETAGIKILIYLIGPALFLLLLVPLMFLIWGHKKYGTWNHPHKRGSVRAPQLEGDMPETSQRGSSTYTSLPSRSRYPGRTTIRNDPAPRQSSDYVDAGTLDRQGRPPVVRFERSPPASVTTTVQPSGDSVSQVGNSAVAAEGTGQPEREQRVSVAGRD